MHFGWLRSVSLRVFKFVKIKEGWFNFWGNQFCRMSGLFAPHFCISILKVLWTQFLFIHYISVHSAWMRKAFLRVLKFLQIKEGGPNFWVEPILQDVWIIWSSLLYLNLTSAMDPNSSSFIRFQSILQESGRLSQSHQISTN